MKYDIDKLYVGKLRHYFNAAEKKDIYDYVDFYTMLYDRKGELIDLYNPEDVVTIDGEIYGAHRLMDYQRLNTYITGLKKISHDNMNYVLEVVSKNYNLESEYGIIEKEITR